MTTYADQLFQFGGVPVGAQDLLMAGGKWYFCDPTHGTSGGDALTPETANSSLLVCYNKTRSGYNDGVFFIGGATAYNPAAAFTWSNTYCHLIGITPVAGLGSRCRIVNTTANDLAQPFFTLSGTGCRFYGIKFSDEKDADADSGALLVSGNYCKLVGCQVSGMAGAASAARAGSYSMKVTGGEVQVEDCYIGLDTVARTAASSELIVAGVRFRAKDTTIATQAAAAAANFLVKIDNSAADLRDVVFSGECRFSSYNPNWAAATTNAITIPAAGNTVLVDIGPNCRLLGVSMTWADNLTHVYMAGPAPNAGFGIPTNPTS